MSIFHEDRGPLHGMTVVVETTDNIVYIGRCHEESDQRVVLLDVDVHSDDEDGKTKEEYIQHAAKFGVWKKHSQLTLPRGEIESIRRLADIPVQ